jgi:L-alanine-DL-glutamate epimerase-like enolase superfamily enzyme
MLKIVDVKVREFLLPKPRVPSKPYFNAIILRRPSIERRVRITQIETDEDVTGFWFGGNREVIERRIKPKLLGENPLMLERLWQKMYMGGDRKPVAKGDYIAAMSCVDNALWDLAGKILGQPVYRLLGGYSNRVRAYAAGGYYTEEGSVEDLVREMSRYIAERFTAVKMKVGGWRFGIDMRMDVERVKAVREALGDDVDIMVDANNAWNAYEAKRFAKLVEPYHPYWFEEPVNPDDIDGSIEVRMSTTIPIASGENEFTRYGFRDLISRRAVDIVQADPNIAGGLTEVRKIASIAAAYHIDFAPHGNHIIGSHAVAAFPNGLIVECFPKSSPYRDPDVYGIYRDPIEVRDGWIEIPDKPGFGVELDERIAARYEVGIEG